MATTTLVCKQSTSSAVTVSSKLTASATYATNFLRLIGMKTLALNVTAQASDNIPA